MVDVKLVQRLIVIDIDLAPKALGHASIRVNDLAVPTVDRLAAADASGRVDSVNQCTAGSICQELRSSRPKAPQTDRAQRSSVRQLLRHQNGVTKPTPSVASRTAREYEGAGSAWRDRTQRSVTNL